MLRQYKVILFSILVGVLGLEARRTAPAVEKALCDNKKACENRKNKKCTCYCAFKPGPRKKENSDRPIFLENDDHYHNHCYCNQRDLDKLGLSR